jgi:hypothetical protein
MIAWVGWVALRVTGAGTGSVPNAAQRQKQAATATLLPCHRSSDVDR